jgi:hypothetical protein
MIQNICQNNVLIYNKLGYNNGYRSLQASSRSGNQAARIFNFNNRYGLPQNLIPIDEPCNIQPTPIPPSPYPANVNCTTCDSYFYDSSDNLLNIWPNFGGNLANTRYIPQNSIYNVKSENCLSMSCQKQVKLPMTLNGVQISGFSLTYHGICDSKYYYNVIVLDAATYLGVFPVGVLFGIDAQTYGDAAVIIKVNRKTGVVEAYKSCSEITGKPNSYPINSIFDTGDSSTRGPLFLYNNYLYVTGQDTQYSSIYKINTSNLSLVHYEEIPAEFNEIITEISGVTIPKPFKTREMREVLIIPPLTNNTDPDIHNDFKTYPLILVMSTSNTTYVYTTDANSDAERLIRFKNYYRASGMIFAYLDKGATWENVWNFSMAPKPLEIENTLPPTWFSPQTSPDNPAYIWIPIFDGFEFTNNVLDKYTSVGENFVIGSYNFNTAVFESFNTTEGRIQYYKDNAKPGYITFNDGDIFDTDNTYTITLLDNSTYDVSGNQLLGQPIKLYLYPNFTIPINLSTCPGDIIANSASHYGGGIWGSPCWDSKLNLLYVPGGNAYNFPQYERDLRDPAGIKISQNIQNLAQANAVLSDSLIGKPIVPVVEYLDSNSPYKTYKQYLDIQDASLNVNIFFQAQKTFLQEDQALKSIPISERGNRLLDSGIVAINPYKKGGKAKLEWVYRLTWGGIFTIESGFQYPSGLLQTPGFFTTGGSELNNDTLGVSLTTIGYENGVPIRRIVANNKGQISVLDPDAFYSITSSVVDDIDCSQGIATCTPPLLGGVEHSFLSCFPGQAQGPIGGLILMTTTTGKNVIITRDCGISNTVNFQNGIKCTARRIILPKGKSIDRFCECDTGFLTCYDLDEIGKDPLGDNFNKTMLWQIPLTRFGINNGENVPAVGYPENLSNGAICAYGDIITVGMSTGQLWFVDAKDGTVQHKIALCEGIASGGPIVSNQLMLTGGYDKWGGYNKNKGFFYYSFTPNGK